MNKEDLEKGDAFAGYLMTFMGIGVVIGLFFGHFFWPQTQLQEVQVFYPNSTEAKDCMTRGGSFTVFNSQAHCSVPGQYIDY